MTEIALYELSSALHQKALRPIQKETLIQVIASELKANISFFGSNFESFGTHKTEYIFIRTGGTEGLFLEHLGHLFKEDHQEKVKKLSFKLLTSGECNSLAASMEILAFLQQHGANGEIIHGKPTNFGQPVKANSIPVLPLPPINLQGIRLGIIGTPSDWLIASKVNTYKVKEKLNAQLIEIPLTELTDRVFALQRLQKYVDLKSFEGSQLIFTALKEIVKAYHLGGLTLRCFDLLTALHNTGCLALAQLNAEGIPSSCEGDVPALLTMAYAYKEYGTPGFQCNLSRIEQGDEDALLFAHCTAPLNLCTHYHYTTHFESGIGTAIKGELILGKADIIKISPNLETFLKLSGRIVSNSTHPNLCRTQITIHAQHAAVYFLTHPLANHHIVVPHIH